MTTILDLIGALLLIIAAALWVGIHAGPVAAIAAAGVLVIVLSWIVDHLGKGGKSK